MNIGEIIAEVDRVWAPNNVPTAIKCRWLTQDQWQVLRRVRLPGTIDIISTVAGMAAYPLPSNCPPDLLQHVVLVRKDGSQIEYHHRRRMDKAAGRWFNIMPGDVLLLSESTPATDEALVLFYVPRPPAFTPSDLSMVPLIPEEYQEYLVKRLAARCAKANAAGGGGDRDVLLANNFEAEAMEILQRMISDFSPEPAAGFGQEVNW